MKRRKKLLFSGYAPVHFLCFLPIYQLLRNDPHLEIWFSGGFRDKETGDVAYSLEGFYDGYDVPAERIIPVTEARERDFDVVICSHTSSDLFPRSATKSVQIFHGVSFKNYAVREKALAFDYLCLPGRYHAARYQDRGLIREDGSSVFITGFAKNDALVNGTLAKDALIDRLELDADRPTILYAPTGDKYNSLETMGEKVIAAIAAANRWNLLIKLHDHPKRRKFDWRSILAPYESETVRLVRDDDVVPYLHAADLLISDASSVATEYTLLDRPIVLLDVPKLAKGVVKRGGSADLLEYSSRLGPTVKKASRVVAAIAAELAKPRRYSSLRQDIAEEMFYGPGGASERVAAVIRLAAGTASSLPDDVLPVRPEAPSNLEPSVAA
jgi:CDP-glycerol glycerophosphotransferase (TagB/SpsB family)